MLQVRLLGAVCVPDGLPVQERRRAGAHSRTPHTPRTRPYSALRGCLGRSSGASSVARSRATTSSPQGALGRDTRHEAKAKASLFSSESECNVFVVLCRVGHRPSSLSAHTAHATARRTSTSDTTTPSDSCLAFLPQGVGGSLCIVIPGVTGMCAGWVASKGKQDVWTGTSPTGPRLLGLNFISLSFHDGYDARLRVIPPAVLCSGSLGPLLGRMIRPIESYNYTPAYPPPMIQVHVVAALG